MTILGIESSCDETAAALLNVTKGRFSLMSNIVASQARIHAVTGGVVPEVAARNHIANAIPVIKKALGSRIPDVLAVTAGPGLITSLLVGVQTAKTLSWLLRRPLVAVNHIEGHIYANFLDQNILSAQDQKIFPAIILIVSGGHTEIILMEGHGRYTLLGATRDDAAGECFDKTASILGLGYPGGPAIERCAQQGNTKSFDLPRPMLDGKSLEFSFSGLKTSVLYLVQRLKKEKNFNNNVRVDICASLQQAIIDVLVGKTVQAAKKYRVKTVMIGGGVAASKALRAHMALSVQQSVSTARYINPPLKLCTDNAAMIAVAGYFHAVKKDFSHFDSLDAMPRWELTGE